MFCYYLICSFVRQITSISGYVAIQPVLVEDLCFCLPIIRYIFIANIICNTLKHKKPLITSDRVSENPSSGKNPVYQRGNISYKDIQILRSQRDSNPYLRRDRPAIVAIQP